MSTPDRVRFVATSAGTGPFVVASAAPPAGAYLTPAGAGIVDGTPFSYIAQNPSNVAEWEYGHSITTSSGTSIARAPIRSSSGVGATVSFGNPPQVAFGLLAEDLTGLNVKMFGVLGDGVTDDTAAIQKAITYITTNRLTLWFPAGTYKITDVIEFPVSNSWAVDGDKGAVISQTTSGKSIFHIGHGDTWNFAFRNLSLQWTSQQTSVCSAFDFTYIDGVLANGVYEFELRNITVTNAYRVIDNFGASMMSVWGGTFRQMVALDCDSFCFLNGTDGANPNLHFDHIYWFTSRTTANTVITIGKPDGLLFNNIEFNAGTYTNDTAIFFLIGVGTQAGTTILQCRIEAVTISTPGCSLIYTEQPLAVEGFIASNLTLAGTTFGISAHFGGAISLKNAFLNASSSFKTIDADQGKWTYAENITLASGALLTAATLPNIDATTPALLSAYAIGSLPVTPTTGSLALITDQLTTPAAKGAAPTAGGSVKCVVIYNGSAWVGI